MGTRARRIINIEHDSAFFKIGTKLSDLILNHRLTNDNRNIDGLGIVEFPYSVLIDIFHNQHQLLDKEELEDLEKEISKLETLNTDDDEYIIYDCW